jgi:hypothetical protein
MLALEQLKRAKSSQATVPVRWSFSPPTIVTLHYSSQNTCHSTALPGHLQRRGQPRVRGEGQPPVWDDLRSPQKCHRLKRTSTREAWPRSVREETWDPASWQSFEMWFLLGQKYCSWLCDQLTLQAVFLTIPVHGNHRDLSECLWLGFPGFLTWQVWTWPKTAFLAVPRGCWTSMQGLETVLVCRRGKEG